MKRIGNISKLKLIEFLNRIPLFQTLSPRDRQMVADLPNLIVLIPANETFIKRGEYDSSFYILLNGNVNVTMQKKHVADVGPGNFIGEVGFICNEPRSATVTTIDEVIAMRITKELFDKLPIKVREVIKEKIISGLVDRVVSQNSQIVTLKEEVQSLKMEEFDQEAADQQEHALDIKPVEDKATSEEPVGPDKAKNK